MKKDFFVEACDYQGNIINIYKVEANDEDEALEKAKVLPATELNFFTVDKKVAEEDAEEMGIDIYDDTDDVDGILTPENIIELKTILKNSPIKSFDEIKIAIIDPISLFLIREAEFRLKEFHNIEKPSEELVEVVSDVMYDEMSQYVDYDQLDDIIAGEINEFYKDKEDE